MLTYEMIKEDGRYSLGNVPAHSIVEGDYITLGMAKRAGPSSHLTYSQVVEVKRYGSDVCFELESGGRLYVDVDSLVSAYLNCEQH